MKKIDRIVLIISIITMIIGSSIGVYAVSYIHNANEVYYDNSTSNLTHDNVQGALDELYMHATDYSEIKTRLTTVENKLYPVGSIYISVEDDTVAKVQAKLGGTWESFGAGRVLLGIGSNGTTNYSTVGATGGSESQSYTPAGTNSGGAVSNTTLTTNQIPSHTHTYAKPNANTGSTVLTINQIPAHSHTSKGWAKVTDGSGSYVTLGGAGQTTTYSTNSAGGGQGHTHTQPTTSTASGAAGGSGAHNHGFTQPTFTGKASTISHMQPYITVYMYKRTK